MLNSSATPLRSAREEFIQDLRNKNRATATILAYGKDIEQLIEFLEKIEIKSVDAITPEHIKAFTDNLSKLDYTAKSISRKINSIKSFFRFLRAKEYVETNPAANITHPRYEVKPPRVLSKMEYRALRDACRSDTRISAIIELLLQTGIRIGELANLRFDDLDIEKGMLSVRAYESHGPRSIPLTKAARKSLENYLKERPKTRDKTLFVTKTGRPFLVRNIRAAIDRYFKIAGIENARVNDLRHTFIAQQLIAGTPLVYVSKLAGHKRLSTTEKYLKIINEKMEKDEVKLEEL
jgi:site-specific recombinase XerD